MVRFAPYWPMPIWSFVRSFAVYFSVSFALFCFAVAGPMGVFVSPVLNVILTAFFTGHMALVAWAYARDGKTTVYGNTPLAILLLVSQVVFLALTFFHFQYPHCEPGTPYVSLDVLQIALGYAECGGRRSPLLTSPFPLYGGLYVLLLLTFIVMCFIEKPMPRPEEPAPGGAR